MGLFSTFFRDEIAIAPFTGFDADGNPTFSARVRTTARVEDGMSLRRGEALDSKVEFTVATEYALKNLDRVWVAPQTSPPREGRTFPPGYAFADADSRQARDVRSASGIGFTGHSEAHL